MSLAKAVASLESLVSAFDIIYVAKITSSKDEDVAKLYSSLVAIYCILIGFGNCVMRR